MKQAAKATSSNRDNSTGRRESVLRRIPFEYPAFLLALGLVMLTLLEFFQNQKWLVLVCCILSVLISGIAIFGKNREERPRLFFLVFCAYLLFLGLGILWAVSGRFFFREYSKYLITLPLMLYILCLMPKKDDAVRKLLFVMSAVGAWYALLSIDNATVGLSHGLLHLIPGFQGAATGFERGTRLTGIFSNGNISAGLLAVCFFLSMYLLESADTKRQRAFAVVFASFQAGTLLLNFSLGATGFFLVSALVYLVFAGERRGSVFLRLLEIAVPVIVSVFISFRFFEASDGSIAIPLIAAILSAGIAVLLELTVVSRLSQRLAGHQKRTAVLFCAAFLLIAAYASAGLLLRGSAELPKGQSLRRACYPAAGDYTLSVTAEGNVNVRIISQNEREVVMHTQSVLYSGAASEAAFTVPEGSLVVYLTFTSPEGATLRDVTLLGPSSVSLHLGYPLLPSYIANRLQGLFANENAIQRGAFFRDGMKIFRDHPILGAGLGSFETLLFGYQEFYYETKYVHNHYIQVLLDSGIIGCILYLALLLLTAAALWRGRKKDLPFRSLHPALCAAFVMILLHSGMEVVLSSSVYLPYAYAVFSLIALCYAPDAAGKAAEKASAGVSGVLALIYALLIILNLNADATVRKSTNNATRFFNALEYAAKVDAFEKNDWKVSYLSTCADLESSAYRLLSDRYAKQLLNVPSNSLHQHLIRYYLVFRDYDQALQAAKKSVSFTYSDSANWNEVFALFSSALSSNPEDVTEILNCVRAMAEELDRYQERLIQPIQLDSVSNVMIAAATKE